jgi:signal transduction histidine kinase
MQLRRDDRAKDEFLAMLSHELRTPLTSILGWASVLAAGNVDPPLATTAIESIVGSAQSQQRLIDELLDVSRILFHKLRFDMHPLELGRLVQASADVIRPMSAQKRVALSVEIPDRPCMIEGDDGRIRQVLSNLLSNAVKFTPAGGWIALRLEIFDSHANVVVSDAGEGIEPSVLPRLFDRFQQADGSAAKGGLGLGLAIARHVVEAHHGSLTAFSGGRGTGSTFTARFPLSTTMAEAVG